MLWVSVLLLGVWGIYDFIRYYPCTLLLFGFCNLLFGFYGLLPGFLFVLFFRATVLGSISCYLGLSLLFGYGLLFGLVLLVFVCLFVLFGYLFCWVSLCICIFVGFVVISAFGFCLV